MEEYALLCHRHGSAGLSVLRPGTAREILRERCDGGTGLGTGSGGRCADHPAGQARRLIYIQGLREGAHLPRPGVRPSGTGSLPPPGIDPDEGVRLEGLHRTLPDRRCPVHPVRLRGTEAAGAPSPQPGAGARHEAGPGLQHRGQLRHQHQLAGLRGRDPGLLPLPDDGDDRAACSPPPHPGWWWPSPSCAASPGEATTQLGNFYVDFIRAILRILLPLASW